MDLLAVGNGGELLMDFSTRAWHYEISVFYPDGGLAANAAESGTPQDVGYCCWDYEYRTDPEGDHLIASYLTGDFADDAAFFGRSLR